MKARHVRRLMFVSDAGGFGGAERYILAMAAAAGRRGIEPCICWLRPPGVREDVFATPELPGLRVRVIAAERSRSLPKLVRGLRTVLAEERPEAMVINASGRPGYWWTAWQARWGGIPAVWVHQMIDGRDHRRLPPRWLGGRMEGPQWWRIPQTLRHQLAALAVRALVTLNAEDRRRVVRLHAVPPHRIRVIPHGIDGERFRDDPREGERLRRAWGIPGDRGDGPFVVGTAVRLVPGKGVETLIEAVALLAGRGERVKLVIAGEGPYRGEFARLSARLGVADRVGFVGFIADMPVFYSAVDCFALCSVTESFGLALAEAMACRRPVIATPTAGAQRQIEHGVSGWLLAGFSAGELAEAIAGLKNDVDRCRRMGEAARRRAVECFGIERTLERTLRALSGPVGEDDPPGPPEGHDPAHTSRASGEGL